MQSTRPGGYFERDHGADAALEVHAPDLPGLFTQSARGMYDLMGVRPGGLDACRRSLEVQAADTEGLLVSFLTDLLFLLEQENLVALDSTLVFDVDRLQAGLECWQAGAIQREIKAVTFHELAIRQDNRGFETVIVFDL